LNVTNDLVREEYPYRPLCSSDRHSINRTIRNEIGKSGCIFPDFDFSSGVEFREKLRNHIKDGNFETYLKCLGPVKFIGIVQKCLHGYDLSSTSLMVRMRP